MNLLMMGGFVVAWFAISWAARPISNAEMFGRH